MHGVFKLALASFASWMRNFLKEKTLNIENPEADSFAQLSGW
jgi:hypothetical protein